MYKRALAAVGIAVAASTVAAIAPVSAADSKSLTIADVLLADDQASGQANVLDRNWRDYDLLTAAVLAVGATDLVPAAANKDAALTVLAPNDQAFRLLARDLTKKPMRTEQQVLDALLAVEAGAPGTIKTVLTYHIVPAKLGPAAVQDLCSEPIEVEIVSFLHRWRERENRRRGSAWHGSRGPFADSARNRVANSDT